MSLILPIISWWFVVSLIGLAALPLAWRLMAALPDRGYAFARPLGLLLAGYVLWIGSTLHFLQNDTGGVVFALLLVAILSLVAGWPGLRSDEKGQRPLQVWLGQHRTSVIATEALFALAFLVWGLYRAYNPEIAGTEKPMEFAFINGILRSPTMPPLDPWLSGFAISYYYFGYVIMAALTRLTGVPSSYAFNLGIALLFALTATGAYGVVYNLAALLTRVSRRAIAYGLIAALFVVLLGNLEGALEVGNARGLGSQAFYQSLGIKGLGDPPPTASGLPTDNWWWWRASRVVQDHDLTGRPYEVIDEFPLFSFLLGDMHPHVLGLPFVLLATALALGLYLKVRMGDEAQETNQEGNAGQRIEDRRQKAGEGLPSAAVLGITAPALPAQTSLGQAGRRLNEALETLRSDFPLGWGGLALYALVLGGLAFLNTWDFPIYLGLTALAYGVAKTQQTIQEEQETNHEGHKEARRIEPSPIVSLSFWDFAANALIAGGMLGVLGVLFYLPFYLGFTSQANGVIPNLVFPTALIPFLVMWGTFLVLVVGLVVASLAGQKPVAALSRVGQALVYTLGLPILFLVVMLLLAAYAPLGQDLARRLLDATGQGLTVQQAVASVVALRLQTPWALLIPALLLAGVVAGVQVTGYRFRVSRVESAEDEFEVEEAQAAEGNLALTFALLLAGVGLALIGVVELLYLRDSFGWRMNTVFKFYYQAWILLALASAFAVAWLVERVQRPWRTPILAVGGLLVLLGLLYPAVALPSKANNFAGPPTLDGADFIHRYQPEEYTAIRWLWDNVRGAPLVLEATGGSYTDSARVSAFTGLPTLLGWGGHELQWRGNYDEPGRREPVIERIYRTANGKELQDLLTQYGVDYVYIGRMEIDKYKLTPPVINRFTQVMDLVYDKDNVKIFRKRGPE